MFSFFAPCCTENIPNHDVKTEVCLINFFPTINDNFYNLYF